MKKGLVQRGQTWKAKDTGKLVRVVRKVTGNFHWMLDNGHHIHEGTLQKYYELL